MTAIPSTQIPVEYAGKSYSGVYSVSGTLMIARVPGIGSSSVELGDEEEVGGAAVALLVKILQGAEQEGRL